MFPPVGFPEPPPAPAVPVSGQRALHKSRPRSVDPQLRIIAAQRCSLVWISRTRRSARNSTSSVSSVFTNGLRAFQCPPCRLAGPLRHVHASRVLGLLRDLRPVPRPPVGNGPAHPPDRLPGGEGRPGTVPTFTWNRSMREAPASTPTASPRLRRRPSAWPPHRTHKPASELIHLVLTRRGSCAAHRPLSVRFEPALDLRGFRQRFLSYAFSSLLAGPGSSEGADPSRTLSELLPPSRAFPRPGCSQLHRPAATDRRWSPLTSTRFQAPRGALSGARTRPWRLISGLRPQARTR